MAFITVLTAFLLGVQHETDSVENKPASSLVVSLGFVYAKTVQRQTVIRFAYALSLHKQWPINRPKYKILCWAPLSNTIQITFLCYSAKC